MKDKGSLPIKAWKCSFAMQCCGVHSPPPHTTIPPPSLNLTPTAGKFDAARVLDDIQKPPLEHTHGITSSRDLQEHLLNAAEVIATAASTNDGLHEMNSKQANAISSLVEYNQKLKEQMEQLETHIVKQEAMQTTIITELNKQLLHLKQNDISQQNTLRSYHSQLNDCMVLLQQYHHITPPHLHPVLPSHPRSNRPQHEVFSI